jgi:para-aminobenzoate synthetase component 1
MYQNHDLYSETTDTAPHASSFILHPSSLIPHPSLPWVEEWTPTPSPETLLKRLAGLPHVIFFDSVLRHPTLGRYSFLTADPFEWIRARGSGTSVSTESVRRQPADPFVVLAERLGRYRTVPLPGLPPFQGGAAGLFGYDLCHHVERLPRARLDEFEVPDFAVGLYDWVIAFDHVLRRAWLISTGFPEMEPACRLRQARRRANAVKQWLEAAQAGAERPMPVCLESPANQWPVEGCPGVLSNFSREGYLSAARRVIDYIHAGDCFQVNLAQRLLYPAHESPLELYLRLRARNPATFAGYLDLGDFTIASASPERFLRVEKSEVETRPIKGTRPRGTTPDEDQARIRELLHSEKDRAENIMIVDLLRNDLGRVCRYGSVRVAAVCRLESYRFVHHLVSEIRGKLKPELGPLDLLRAAFPGGSVTGAPKIRAMEIIAELEPTARGPYCGSLGYVGFDGTMDSNILIRTLTIGRGWVQFPVGGGIVADSVPEHEYEETWHKAEGLLRTVR